MKNYLIIIGLSLFLVGTSFAYEKVYLDKNYSPTNTYTYPTRTIYSPYNSQYYSPYAYQRMNANNVQRLNRLRLIRRMNQRRNLWNNFLTWNNNKNDNGAMTGYSVPVTEDDVHKQMGITPYDPKAKQTQKPNSPTCKTELFSSPMGDEMYYTNGERRVNLGGASGKTGVTIIYD